ncbi:DUF3365 domain-containing protein [Duganella sp. FT135W]|uniref:histidine kinase n=1 Tax=Duganella flavida TaxID=2692175 RepID=A0A6L8K576_9BURK|nr:ATP-binding protein [Duganella flavida]MYM22663.1 DUF3365 domain-containing protein [Duganella flavida]
MKNYSRNLSNIYRITFGAVILWSCLISGSYFWSNKEIKQRLMDAAYAEARTNLNKDISFRRWATDHGGIYLEVGPEQAPAQWLDHVPGHVFKSTDGREFTLINPAAVLRQVMDRYAADYGVRGRIVGLQHLNPANAPDSWEIQQLKRFNSEPVRESWQITEDGGKPFLRYLRAMKLESGCMKCHSSSGFAVGEIIGGTGGSFPLSEYFQKISETRNNLALTHFGFWIVGLCGIAWSSRRVTLAVNRGHLQDMEQAELYEELQESEARWKFALEGAGDGVWELRIDTNETFYTARWLEMLALSNSEIGNAVEGYYSLVHPQDIEIAKSCINDAIARITPAFAVELRFFCGDGSWKWIMCRGKVIDFFPDGRPLRVIGTHTDISKRKSAEQEMLGLLAATELARNELKMANATMERKIAARTKQLRSANSELEAFCYSVSHDLRSPLRGIDGWSLALLEDCHQGLGEEGMSHLSRIRSESQRMGLLIDGMLELSRLGRSQISPSALNLSEIGLEIVQRLAQDVQKIEFEIAPGMVASADKVLMEIVIQNIFENAIKFTTGKKSPKVKFYQEMTPLPDGGIVNAFVVEDNGVGFDPRYEGKLFGVFQRLHRASEFPGTGIGLATVKRIISRHSGHIWAKSSVGDGAKFYFTLGDAQWVQK